MAARAAEYPHSSPCATFASPLMLPGQSYHRPSGMTITPWQSAPDAATAPLNGWLHRGLLNLGDLPRGVKLVTCRRGSVLRVGDLTESAAQWNEKRRGTDGSLGRRPDHGLPLVGALYMDACRLAVGLAVRQSKVRADMVVVRAFVWVWIILVTCDGAGHW